MFGGLVEGIEILEKGFIEGAGLAFFEALRKFFGTESRFGVGQGVVRRIEDFLQTCFGALEKGRVIASAVESVAQVVEAGEDVGDAGLVVKKGGASLPVGFKDGGKALLAGGGKFGERSE